MGIPFLGTLSGNGRTNIPRNLALRSDGVAADYVVTSDGTGGTTWTLKGAPSPTVEQSGNLAVTNQYEVNVIFSPAFLAKPAALNVTPEGGASIPGWQIKTLTKDGFTVEFSDYWTGRLNWLANG